jgi:hypothetical protein
MHLSIIVILALGHDHAGTVAVAGHTQIIARLCRNVCRGHTNCTPLPLLAGACNRDVI